MLRLQLGVAKELGYTLAEMNNKLTPDELVLWSVYFELLNDEQDEQMKAARRRR